MGNSNAKLITTRLGVRLLSIGEDCKFSSARLQSWSSSGISVPRIAVVSPVCFVSSWTFSSAAVMPWSFRNLARLFLNQTFEFKTQAQTQARQQLMKSILYTDCYHVYLLVSRLIRLISPAASFPLVFQKRKKKEKRSRVNRGTINTRPNCRSTTSRVDFMAGVTSLNVCLRLRNSCKASNLSTCT